MSSTDSSESPQSQQDLDHQSLRRQIARNAGIERLARMSAVDAMDESLRDENEMVRVHNTNNERELYDDASVPTGSNRKKDEDMRNLIAGDNVVHHHHPAPTPVPAQPPPIPRTEYPPARTESNRARNLLLAAAIGGSTLGGLGGGLGLAALLNRSTPEVKDTDTRFEPFILPIQPK